MIEMNYSHIPKDNREKIIDNYLSLVESASGRQSLRSTLDQTTKLIFRLFGFREVSIGLKSREDSFYRYEALFGYRGEVAEKFRRLKYTYEDMVSKDKYPNIKMGKLSELNPVEGLPKHEKDLFNRPYQLEAARKSYDEFHEGDYIDVWIYGNSGDLIGWIELSSTVDFKLPSKETVRWIELLAAMLGRIIVQKWAEEDLSRR